MAILEEIWVKDIQEGLFESNQFLTHSVDHSPYVHGSLVHLQEVGSAAVTEKSRTDLPATVGTRTDNTRTYTIYSRSSNPVLVSDLESLQLSYEKRQSVLRQHMDQLMEDVGKDIAYEWAATQAGRIIRTSGDDTNTNLAGGATGTRNAITLKDVADMTRKFDMDNVPAEGRFLMLHPMLYYELFSIDSIIRADVMGRATLPKGAITQLFGFNILVKPSVPVYTNATTPVPKEPGLASAATDNLCAMAWQRGCVARALGSIEVYEDQKNPLYYGDIISARIFCGGVKLRTNQTGVGAIVQAAG